MVTSIIRCPLCNSLSARSLFKKQGYYFHACLRCGHGFVSPLPDQRQTELHYRNSYDSTYLGTVRAWYEALARKRVEIVNGWCSDVMSGTLLDAGCGYGFFLAEAQKQGWKVAGIESAAAPVKFAQEQLGVKIITGDIFNEVARIQPGAYDVATFWHVLEHVEEPSKVLSATVERLNDGGYVIVNSPSIDSAIYKIFGKRWSWIYAPGHIQYFMPGSLATWFHNHGLKVLTVETWTEAPNLFFAVEESLALAFCDFLTWCRVPGLGRVANRMRGFVHGRYHQQDIQKKLKWIYDRMPLLDSFLKRRNLGHEFLIVAKKTGRKGLVSVELRVSSVEY